MKRTVLKILLRFNEKKWLHFTGGVDQDLFLEIHNIDIDFEGKNKKILKYIDDNWVLQ